MRALQLPNNKGRQKERWNRSYSRPGITTMIEPSVLLITEDSALLEAVKQEVASIAGLRLEHRVPCQMARAGLPAPHPAILLAHMVHPGDAAEAARLLRMVAEARLPIP